MNSFKHFNGVPPPVLIKMESSREKNSDRLVSLRSPAAASTWFSDDLLQLLVQAFLPLGECDQPLLPHPLQVHLLHTRTHASAGRKHVFHLF